MIRYILASIYTLCKFNRPPLGSHFFVCTTPPSKKSSHAPLVQTINLQKGFLVHENTPLCLLWQWHMLIKGGGFLSPSASPLCVLNLSLYTYLNQIRHVDPSSRLPTLLELNEAPIKFNTSDWREQALLPVYLATLLLAWMYIQYSLFCVF
jgi:hypothetical protein